MRRRIGVAEGVVIGTAVANSRRPPVVAVPVGYPAYYGAPVYGAPVSSAAYYPPQATEIVVNTSAPGQVPQQPGAPYYPPQQPANYPPPPPQGANYPPPMPPGAVAAGSYQPQPEFNPSANSQAYAPEPVSAPVDRPPPAPAAAPHIGPAAAAGIEAAAIAKAVERRHFLIVNEANCSVLQVHKGSVKPNATVVVDKRRQENPAQQVWYLDEEGIIRSKLTDFAMESKENGGPLRMMPYTGDARQKWTFQNNRMVNAVFCNDCISLKRGIVRLSDDADVISCQYEGKPYQHWRMENI